MSRRYMVRPAASWHDDEPMLPSLTVYEPDDRPQRTGLYDQHGNELVSVPERQPLGFVHFRSEA